MKCHACTVVKDACADSGTAPDVCGECSRQGLTCCQSGNSGLEMRFPLSSSEIAALTPFAGRAQKVRRPEGADRMFSGGPSDVPAGTWVADSEEQFYTLVPNAKCFVDALCVLFPGETAAIRLLYPLGQDRAVLAVTRSKGTGTAQAAARSVTGSVAAESARCVFLGAAGCVLPQAARPWHCRLFPFWIARGKPRLLDVDTCLAVLRASARSTNHNKRLEQLLCMLDTDLNGLHELHKGLRAAWGLDAGKL